MRIRKRDIAVILSSLAGGVVPNRGLEYIIIGREKEMKQIHQDLAVVKDGQQSLIKFFVGAYGTGKSFMQGYIRQVGFNKGFVVANADFTPDRRLYGNDGQAVALYSELMKNLSSKIAPYGNALPMILDQWIADVQNNIVESRGYDEVDLDNPEFVQDVEKEITKLISDMDELTGGYDFAKVLSIYFRSFVERNQELKRCALRWIRGEYSTKTDALRDLGIREIINDDNYYGYLKVISKFIRQIGYSGLIINFDEAINLYKITHSQARQKNYEVILTIYNDILQGNVEGLYITFSGTPQFLEDERRGVYSYQALKRRLKPGFEDEEYRDLKQPVIRLTPITANETLALLMNLRDLHSIYYDYKPMVTNEEIKNFLLKFYERPGAEKYIILGDIIRQFISRLNVLYENPDMDRVKLFGKEDLEKHQERGTPKQSNVINSAKRFQRGSY